MDKKCVNCGKYPFCNKIENSQQPACEKYVKRTDRQEKLVKCANGKEIKNGK